MDTDSEGRTPLWRRFALAHSPVNRASPWKSAVLSASYLCLSVFICGSPLLLAAPADGPQLVSAKKIWDTAPHNAFTDLTRFHDKWFCTFREADGHVRGNGSIRVITSTDGEQWESAALLSEEGIDLRDPKLSITPDGRLLM